MDQLVTRYPLPTMTGHSVRRLAARPLSPNCGHSSGCYNWDMIRAWFPGWTDVGHVRGPSQGWCVLAAMLIIFLPLAALFSCSPAALW
jgi:hypothetical protein